MEENKNIDPDLLEKHAKLLAEKNRDVKKERRRISKLVTDLPERTLQHLQPTLDKMAWLRVEIDLLADYLAANGWTEIYTNGKHQAGVKQSSYADAYFNCVKAYQASYKILAGYLPKEEQKKKKSALNDFLQSRGGGQDVQDTHT